jgi:hypothetical protein
MINTVYAHLTPQDPHVAMMKALLQDDDKHR